MSEQGGDPGSAGDTTRRDVTRLLRAWQSGDAVARETLMAMVYSKVRAIAAQSLRRAPGASLTPTELAHEALLRLLDAEASWEDRRHFFHVIAQATRQVLVDAARRRLADKRGGGVEALDLDQAQAIASPAQGADILRVNDALDALAASDERRARVIELTYFGGFDRNEIAAALEVSVPTVDRDLRFARAWLKDALTP
jgi:RNA polymerase sigma-70 factor (ECF subfamily)